MCLLCVHFCFRALSPIEQGTGYTYHPVVCFTLLLRVKRTAEQEEVKLILSHSWGKGKEKKKGNKGKTVWKILGWNCPVCTMLLYILTCLCAACLCEACLSQASHLLSFPSIQKMVVEMMSVNFLETYGWKMATIRWLFSFFFFFFLVSRYGKEQCTTKILCPVVFSISSCPLYIIAF